MIIRKDVWVVLDYVLYDEDGDVLEATDDEEGRPLGFVWGYDFMVPGLERALALMSAGETKELVVPPEDAYGPHDESLEHWVDREDFPAELEIDDEFAAESDSGEEITLRVVAIEDDTVLVDANHPLAGETLRFEVMVRSVRAATEAEIAAARAVAPKKKLALAAPAPHVHADAEGHDSRENAPEAAPAPEPEPPAAQPPKPSKHGKTSSGGTHPPAKGLRKERRRERDPGPLPKELDDEQ